MSAVPAPRPIVLQTSLEGSLVVAACLALAALVWQLTQDVNADVSWLLDLGERTLGGARPYVDFFEVNPPASVLLYLPAVAAARLVGLSSETMTILFVVGGCGLSLGLCGRILAQDALLATDRRGVLLCLVVAVLLILPMNTFAEREHIAVLACLPVLAAIAARVDGRTPRWPDVILAGLGAGIAVAIKPMFALALVGPVGFLAFRRSWRSGLGLPEAWIGAAVAALYGAGVLILVPAFAERVLPVALAVYVPGRLPMLRLVGLPGALIFGLLALAFARIMAEKAPSALATVLALAGLGFELVFLWQGKGFNYHAYPAIALGLLALAVTVAGSLRAGETTWRTGLNAAVLALGFWAGLNYFDWRYDTRAWAPGLAEAMTAIKTRPTVLAVTPEIAVGHPFVRQLGGRWVGRLPSTWISANAEALAGGSTMPDRLAQAVQLEKSVYTEDLRTSRPDFVLVDDVDGRRWIDSFAPFRQALDPYRIAGIYGRITLWARKDLQP